MLVIVTDEFTLNRHTVEAFLAEDGAVESFNIGMNTGEVAGQTVMGSQVHLIPKRRGEVNQPRGGVRAVIPGKASY